VAYSVTSWFQEQTELNFSAPVRKLTIGNSDYSSHVLKWPVIRKSWNDIRPTNLTLDLANEDREFTFIQTDFTKLRSVVKIEFGYTHPSSGSELITLFEGTIEKVRYTRGKVNLTSIDKFSQLSDRVLGSSDEPLEFVNSNYLPSDIVWYAVTSYGGYSNITSTSNPDIDYEKWLEWSSIFSASTVFTNARFEGEKVTEVLRKIGRMTSSAIFIDNNRITFYRFSLVNSLGITLGINNTTDKFDVELDDRTIINKQLVFADYDVTSNYFKITVNDEDNSSVNSFGLRERIEKDEVIWYVNSVSAVNYAQRIVTHNKLPYENISLETSLVGLTRFLGENVTMVNSFFNINGTYRIMDYGFNTDTGLLNFKIDKSQFSNPFILNTSSLGGVDVLT